MNWNLLFVFALEAWSVCSMEGYYQGSRGSSVWGYFTPPLLQRVTPQQPEQSPMDAMVDIINNLGVAILRDHSYSRGNFAFSPYGAASVLVVLYEGSRGESARQIHRAIGFPSDKDVIRIGFRDIHRRLRSYFSHEGYLSGITLNKEGSTLKPEYKKVLRFYGYDVELNQVLMEENDVVPENFTSATLGVGAENSNSTEKQQNPDKVIPDSSNAERGNMTVSPPEDKKPESFNLLNPVESGAEKPGLNISTPDGLKCKEGGKNSQNETRCTSEGIKNETENSRRPSGEENDKSQRGNTGEEKKQSQGGVTESTSNNEDDKEKDKRTPEGENPPKDTSEEDQTSDQTSNPADDEKEKVSSRGNTTENQSSAETFQTEDFGEGGRNSTENKQPEDVGERPQQELTDDEEREENTAGDEHIKKENSVASVASSATSSATETMETKEAEKTEGTEGKEGKEGTEKSVKTNLDNGMLIPQPDDREPTTEVVTGKDSTETDFESTTAEMTTQFRTETTTQTFEESSSRSRAFNSKEGRALLSTNKLGAANEIKLSNSTGGKSVGKIRELFDARVPLWLSDGSSDRGPRTKRTITDYLKSPSNPDLSLQLQNGMYDSHVSRNSDTYRSLPRLLFLVDGAVDTPVPTMTYTHVFPYGYVPGLHAKALEFPLDDIRYKLLILLPVERRGLRQLIYDLADFPLRDILESLRPSRVKAMIPTFMVEGFVILTSSLQKLGIWDVFDPRKSNLSGMSTDPELYVRNVEQSVTVVIRNYVEILDIQTRTMAARQMEQEFEATHPFLYFVLDAATNVALMAGQMLDPLNSRIY